MFIDMHSLAYLTTYCTQNEHNSDGRTRPKTIVAVRLLWAEATNNLPSKSYQEIGHHISLVFGEGATLAESVCGVETLVKEAGHMICIVEVVGVGGQ